MKLSTLLTGGQGFGSRALSSRESIASICSPVSSPRALEDAIEAASFAKREPDDDGERVAVISPALGGAFIFSREEAERRITKYFPDVAFEDVTRAARHLESKVRIFLRPFNQASRQQSSWVHGWRD